MKKSLHLFILATAILFLPLASYSQANLLTNGSFEIGVFDGWTRASTQGSHYCTNWTIESAGRSCFGSATAPRDGTREALTGFDGSGGIMTLYQDITLPALSSLPLTFSFRAQTNIPNATNQARTFNVQVRDTSNNVLATLYTYNSTSGGVRDSGWRTETFYLNQYFGQTVRITFQLVIPQGFTGPGQFELDNVILQSFGPTAAEVGVGGRVQNSNGYGIGQAVVSFVNADGNTRSAITNNFGNFTFNDVEVGNTYVFQVSHKQHQFPDSPRVITLDEARKDLIFTSSSSFLPRSKTIKLKTKIK